MIKKLIVLVALAAAGYWYTTWPSYWREEKIADRVIRYEHRANALQMTDETKNVGAAAFRQKRVSSQDALRSALIPPAQRSAMLDQTKKEWLATAKGQRLPAPPRYIAGKRTTWMYTGIPIYSCVHITATGQVTRGDYTKAGPDGVNLEQLAQQGLLAGFLEISKDKKTLVPGVPWGTLMGKSCSQEDGQLQCGQPFPIRSSRFVSAEQVGPGDLWTIINGYVSETRGPDGKRSPLMSDYNVYEGGFDFDQAPTPAASCEEPSS